MLYDSCNAFENGRKLDNGQLRNSYPPFHSSSRLTTTPSLGQGVIFYRSTTQSRSEPLYFDREIVSYFQHQNISWKMNPPSAPHFGGVWERLVQTIKQVFLLNFGSARLSLDLFITIVGETERFLNVRPLTHVSSDVADDLPHQNVSF